MDCPDCTAAARALHYGFTAHCSGCRARMAARTLYFRSDHSHAYRRMLEQLGLTHEQVKQAAAVDFASREMT